MLLTARMGAAVSGAVVGWGWRAAVMGAPRDPSPLRGGRTRPQGRAGWGRRHRALAWTGVFGRYRRLTTGGSGRAPTPRPPPLACCASSPVLRGVYPGP